MSANKFKVGDIVKCVNNYGLYHGSLTVGKEYKVLQNNSDDTVVIENDDSVRAYYCLSRFELSKSVETSQQPKFKEGDMVYLIGFDCLKPHKLLSTGDAYLTMKFRVIIDDDNYKTFTKDGRYLNGDIAPSIVLATEENRQMLNKLLGVEYEPVKLKGSDLARKLLKDNPQTCFVSDRSDEYASSNKCIDLISKFENGAFITMSSDVHWKFAVPCNQHGRILEDK